MEYCRIKDLPGQERLRQLFVYDFETGRLTNRTQRKRRPAGSRSGSIDRNGYRRVFIDGETYAEHRIIWAWVHGSIPSDRLIDHINGDKQDNRIINLRLVTSAENNLNVRISRPNRTGYRGVTYISSTNKYQARIRHEGKNKHLGMFDNALEAFQAYSLARAQSYNSTNNTNTTEANGY